MSTVDRLTTALADRYTIEREIGAGGMATVYLAHDIKHDRTVAIKVLRPELAAAMGAERFLAEIRVTANLQHPNLLPLFDSGAVRLSHPEQSDPEDRGVEGSQTVLYYVMPYVEGETLRSRLDRERQLPVDETIRIVTLLAAALEYAHARGVVHRDLKPENILMQAGQPIIADFGIALAVSEAGGARITGTGLSLGTPQYMSPEQAAGDSALDARTDQYALAAMTYEMLSGEPPHTGATAQVIMARLMTEAPRSLRSSRPGIPATLDATVQRALAKPPADRFASVSEFASALGQGGESSAVPTRNRRVLVAAAVGLVLAVLAVIFVRRDRGTTDSVTLSSVAVLPFEDLSADRSGAYLGDGIAETLINALAGVAGLQVTGRTSSFALRDQADDVEAIGKRLGTATVLEGSVQRAGDQLRITAQLLRTSNAVVLWSQHFDRAAADIFAVQDEVARAVVAALQGGVLGGADTTIAGQGTTNPAAYDAYLLGRHFWGKRTATDLVTAAGHFQRAIAIDSGYARAWSGLADSYVLFIPSEYDVPGVDADSVLGLAERAARHAVSLAPRLGEAWVALAEVLEYRGKWVEAQAAFEKGIALAPKYPTGHLWYAYDLMAWNRWDEAIDAVERARQLDPLSLVGLITAAISYYGAERWADAEAAVEQARAIDPEHALVASVGFMNDLLRGADDRWAADFALFGRVLGMDSTWVATGAGQLAQTTTRSEALRTIADSTGPYFQLVVGRILDGDGSAIAWVEALPGSPDRDMVSASGLASVIGPTLRADPRMQAAMAQLGYPIGAAPR